MIVLPLLRVNAWHSHVSEPQNREKGKEYEAVKNGRIVFEGDRPVNPSGGLIGAGHQVRTSGVRMFSNLYKQIMGNADGYWIADVKHEERSNC